MAVTRGRAVDTPSVTRVSFGHRSDMSSSLRLAASTGYPDELAEELAARRAVIDATRREGSRVFLFATSPDGAIFGRYTTDPADEAVLHHERAVRELIPTGSALRSPAVYAAGPRWMLEQAVESEPCVGAAAVDAIAAAAAEVAVLPLPPGPRQRGVDIGRRAKVLAGIARSALPMQHMWRARRALSRIDMPQVPAHGDFHSGNLLYERGVLWVVDWELSGLRPAGHDLMQAWTTLQRSEDRQRLFETAVSLIGHRYQSQLERLRYAAAVATAVDKLAAPEAFNRDVDGAGWLLEQLPILARELDR
jgi:hypothetical protein